MNTFKNYRCYIVLLTVLMSSASHAQLDAPLSLNVKDSPIKSVLELIAAKAGLELVLDKDPNFNVTLAQSGLSAKQVLDKLSADQQIEYTISGNQLVVIHRKLGEHGTGMGEPHKIPIHFATAGEVSSKLATLIGLEEKIIVDERNNNIVFIGSKRGYEKVLSMVEMLDSAPKQIMIEALIVETSHQFLQDLGISIGDLTDRGLTNDSRMTGYSSNSGPANPNLAFKAILGRIDGRALDIRLTAAESKGNAKVISRPKVSTLNNKQASIQSGISYNIKTLSTVAPGSVVATGGVTTVNAGLALNILPSMVGPEDIRLAVDINNSQPDEGASVDGIPGILKNAANTTVIVKNKQTAVIAGLIKQSHSKSSSGVPILSDIPILGLLFKSNSTSDHNNELVIFLTPTIDDGKPYQMDSNLLKVTNIDAALKVPELAAEAASKEKLKDESSRDPASVPTTVK